MDLARLPTPALILDRGRTQRNAARMKQRASDLGVALRPHLKTAKSVDVARIAQAGGGACVSTLREAEYFAAQGFTDLVWAVCAAPHTLDRAAALVDRGVSLTLLTDSVEGAAAIAAHPSPLRALVEVDSGDHRTGLLPQDEALLRIAATLGDRCAGVLTHAGQSYGCRTPDAIAAVAEDERAAVVAAAERLREQGLPCPVVSLGSTPTATFAEDLTGATEMRPGVYLLGDLFQAAIGTCTLDDIAASVLATVIHASDSRVVIDAGGLALSKDRSTAATEHDAAYGQLCDLAGTPLEGATVTEVHQEHGILRPPPAGLRVGDRVRVLPNHVCMTAAAYDRFHVVDGSEQVLDVWERVQGW
ncbi:MAG: alanine racemase [Myxococcales bacterium]|nr:alanine racemase [Myxococcales bacterium]